MKETSKAYAQALFQLAKDPKEVAQYADFLRVISALSEEHPAYCEMLASPALPLQKRLVAIEEAFSETLPEYLLSFLKLLCENGHIKELPQCIDEFLKLELLLENTMTVQVYSSIPLTDSQKKNLETKLEAKYHKQIAAVYQVDETLIGGIKIVTEDTVLDGSIEKRLQGLKEVIKS